MTKPIQYLLIFLSLCVVTSFIYIFKITTEKINDSEPKVLATFESLKKNEDEITFTFAGDAIFGRAVYDQFGNDLTKAFRDLDQNFFQGDIKILNLEGPIVNQKFIPDITPDNLVMKFPPQTKDALKWLGINTVSLGNNHTFDQGTNVFNFTKELLNNNQITTIGNSKNSADLVQTFQKGNLKISVIAVNTLANTPDLEEKIKEQKENGAFVIIFPHWGDEYQTIHNQKQARLAHTWINQGVDLIIGSHPHVIQDAEIYKEKPIFYSLGNFLFDQTFSRETQRGLAIKGKINAKKLTLELIPLGSLHLRPYVLENIEKEKIINNLKKSLGVETNNSIELDIN
ncbi:MAG: CapA family protein [Patescibacteria group bacterium]|nr:CapA family protein [Patescibacteria group bacterium]